MQITFGKFKINIEKGENNNILNGNYLILIKKNSISIHNDSLVNSIYSIRFGKNTKINYFIGFQNEIIVDNGFEKLTIQSDEKFEIKNIFEVNGKKEIISKNEKNYQNDILKILIKKYSNALKEFETPYGNIDLKYEENEIHYLIELKKEKLKKEDVKQIVRYGDYFKELGLKFKMILIGKDYNLDLLNYGINENVVIYNYEDYTKKISNFN